MENSHAKTILAIAIVIAVGVVLFFIFPSSKDTTSTGNSDVVVERVDLENATGQEKLPKGFPLDIPVDTETIQESYSANYNESGFTQHSLSYKTSDSINSVYESFKSFMEDSGYEITNSTIISNLGSLYGNKDGNDLSIVVSKQSGGNLVNVSYLER